MKRGSTPEMFWARTAVDGDCRVWTGPTDKNGYGLLFWEGKTVRAHRLAFFFREGRWPDSLLRHLCNNPPCLVHVVEGTLSENQRDSIAAGTHRNSRKTHCDHGHPFDEANTYTYRITGQRICRACNRSRKAAARSNNQGIKEQGDSSMTATDSVNDFLLAGGIPAAKFATIGTVVKGSVVASDVMQQTDYATNAPKFFDDGKPMMQAVITLQTDERDPDIDGDDGQRKVYVRGQMTAALREALRAANAKLEIGGVLAVKYDRAEAPEKKGFKPKKVYVAQYRPPAPSTDAANDLLGAGPAAPVSAPVPAASSQPAADDLI